MDSIKSNNSIGEKGTLHRAVHGGKWVSIGSIVNKILGLISFLVLARFVEPASYGLIAIMFILVNIFNQMLVTGFENAIIQRQGEVDDYIHTVWSFNILKAVLVAILIYFLAPPVARYFHAESALTLMRLSGIFVILPSLAPLKQLYLFKGLELHKVFVRDFFSQSGYIVIGAFYAFFVHPDVWALFWANIARYAIPVIVLFYYFPEMPKFHFRKEHLFSLIPYSKWIAGQNVLNYFLSLVDTIIIGRLLSPAILGYYTKGKNLSGVAYAPMGNINRVLTFSAFSRIQEDKEKLKKGFFMVIDLIFFFGVSNVFILWFASDAVVQILLGNMWLPMVPILKIFTVVAIFASFIESSYSLFDGSGKPSITFKSKALTLVFLTILTYVGIFYKSIVGAALGVFVSQALVSVYVMWKLHRVFAFRYSSIIKRLMVVTFPFGGIFLVFTLLYPAFEGKNPWFVSFATGGAYIIACGLFWLVGRRYARGSWHTIKTAWSILFPDKEGI